MTLTPDIAVAIAFVAFVGLVVWKGLARIRAILDKRTETIRGELEEAQNLREGAQMALARAKRQQRDVQGEAEEIIAQARKEAERIKDAAEETLATTLRRREEQAIERIAQAEAQALRDVREQVVDLAVEATSRLIADNSGAEVQNRLIGDAADDLAGKLR